MAGSSLLAPRRASLWALTLLASLGPGTGCGRLREKQSVRRYALATRAVETQARRVQLLDPALEARRVSPETAALRQFLREHYLPALQALVEAIRGLGAETPRLGALKAALLARASQALEAIESLADRVGVGPLGTAWQRALEGRRALDLALASHGKALDALCARHDLRRGGP